MINWTYSETTPRFEVNVGVDYSSVIDQIISIMLNLTSNFDQIKKEPQAFVRFNEFGDSALGFSVFFWCDEIFRIEKIKSDYRIALFKSFKEN